MIFESFLEPQYSSVGHSFKHLESALSEKIPAYIYMLNFEPLSGVPLVLWFFIIRFINIHHIIPVSKLSPSYKIAFYYKN